MAKEWFSFLAAYVYSPARKDKQNWIFMVHPYKDTGS